MVVVSADECGKFRGGFRPAGKTNFFLHLSVSPFPFENGEVRLILSFKSKRGKKLKFSHSIRTNHGVQSAAST